MDTKESLQAAGLLVSEAEKTLRVTLARPDVRNAFNAELIHALATTFRLAEQESNLRTLVLDAAGTTFCAGADFHWMSSLVSASREANMEDAFRLFDMFHALYMLPFPTIARVQGGAFGGGAGLLACCDYVIMAEDAVLSFSEVRIGLVPATIAPFVIKRIGEARAREVFLSGVQITAKRALEIGLVTQIVPAVELDVAVADLLKTLKQCGPQAQQVTKRLVQDIAGLPLSQTRELTARIIADQRVSAEGQEGMQAFLDKRRPNWPS